MEFDFDDIFDGSLEMEAEFEKKPKPKKKIKKKPKEEFKLSPLQKNILEEVGNKTQSKEIQWLKEQVNTISNRIMELNTSLAGLHHSQVAPQVDLSGLVNQINTLKLIEIVSLIDREAIRTHILEKNRSEAVYVFDATIKRVLELIAGIVTRNV